MQFVPSTWSDITRQLGWRNVDPRSPQHAIVAAAFYMRQLRNAWKLNRSPAERQPLALGSYNAGMGNLIAAQERCRGHSWAEIAPCLEAVTGPANARQTRDYVVRISRWRAMMQ